MFKLLALLGAGLFVTLLIGGEDHGQMRHGLLNAGPVTERAAPREVAKAPAKPAKKTTDAAVTLANFSPAKIDVPPAKPAVQRSGPAPIPGPFVLTEPKISEPFRTASLEVEAPAEEIGAPILYVKGSAVNVRQGPSTNFDIVGRLTRAEAVSVVSPEVDGWVQVRIEGDGVEGYIAARLLTEIDPFGN